MTDLIRASCVDGPNPCAGAVTARFERKDEDFTSELLQAVVGHFQQMHTDDNRQRPRRIAVVAGDAYRRISFTAATAFRRNVNGP